MTKLNWNRAIYRKQRQRERESRKSHQEPQPLINKPSAFESKYDNSICQLCGKKHIHKGDLIIKTMTGWASVECAGKSPPKPPARQQTEAHITRMP